MKRTMLTALFAVAIVAMLAPMAHATNLFSANFNNPTYSDGVLNTQAGWTNTSGFGTNNLTVANNPNGNVAMTTGNDERNDGLTGGNVAGASNTTLDLSADIVVSTASVTGDYFLHLGDGGTTNFYDRVWIKASGAGFIMAVAADSSASPTFGSTVLSFGQSYHIDANLLLDSANPDSGSLSVDGSFYVAATTGGTDASTVGGVYLRQGGATTAPGLVIDNISLDIPAVPEPATFVLLGMGMIGFAGTARYRRKR